MGIPRQKAHKAGQNIRNVTALVGVLMTTVGLLVIAPTPASASGTLGDGYNVTVGGGTDWMGNFIIGGQFVYCAAETFNDDPLPTSVTQSATTWIDGSTGGSWTGGWYGSSSAPTIAASGTPLRQSGANLDQANSGGVTQSGITLTGDNLNRIGYVLARYGATGGNDTQAGRVRLLIMEKFRVMISSVAATYLQASTSTAINNRNWIDAVWNEAITYAGPYDTAAMDITVNADQKGGTVDNIGLYSDGGNLYPGATWTATITSGNALWDTTGTTVMSGTTSASLQSAAYHATPTGAGYVDIDVSFTNVPDWRVGVQTSSGGRQSVMHGRTTSLFVPLGSLIPVAALFSAGIDTTTSAAVAAVGDALTDELEVTIPPFGGVWEPGYTMTVASTLYGPFDAAPTQSASVPPGAPVVGTVTTLVTGEGTYTTPAITLPAPGYYAWSESAPADPLIFTGWQSDFARPSEVTLVPWDPSGTTVLDSNIAVPAGVVTDTATITGGQPGGSAVVRFDLYRDEGTTPPAEGSIPAGAVLEDSTSATVAFDGAGAGTASASFTLAVDEEPGYLTVVMTIEPTPTTTEFVANYGIDEETAVVQWDPASATAASRARGNVMSDAVTVSGLPDDYGVLPDETELVTVKMFFVDRTFTGDIATQCVDANFLAAVTIPAVNGTQIATGPAFDLPDRATADMDGWYLFQDSFPGTSRVAPFTGACGEALESLFLVLTSFNGDDLALTGPETWRPTIAVGLALVAVGLMLIVGSRFVPAAAGSAGAKHRGVARGARRRTSAQ